MRLTDFKVLTFDCYGTLVDWESGILAARDVDYGGVAWYPKLPGLQSWMTAYRAVHYWNGGDPDAGRALKAWARLAGFDDVTSSASIWCFATDAERDWWGESWALRATESDFAAHAIESGAAELADLRAHRPDTRLLDVVPAYATVGIFFDADQITLREVIAWVSERAATSRERSDQPAPSRSRLVVIPVCYEMQLDLARVSEHTGLPADDVIRLHTGTEYTVFAVGFVPGFPYLGYLPPELCGVGRLASPRVRVEPGSVGLTGRQTGIYPLPRPGGWLTRSRRHGSTAPVTSQ